MNIPDNTTCRQYFSTKRVDTGAEMRYNKYVKADLGGQPNVFGENNRTLSRGRLFFRAILPDF